MTNALFPNINFIDISILFGEMGKKFIKASLNLRISNDIPNLAFIRHVINYYVMYCTTRSNSQESLEALLSLKKKLPSLKMLKKYFEENELSSLNKFVSPN
jgi:hypothetical protein